MTPQNDMMNSPGYFSEESRAEITNYVHRCMHRIRQGQPLREGIANVLRAADTPEENVAMPDFYMESLDISENNAYFLADYIIARVCEQTKAACMIMDGGDEGVYALLESVIDDLNLEDDKDLYRAVQRMHQMNESLRVILPCVEDKLIYGIPPVGMSVLPAYKGEATRDALEQLMREAAGRIYALSLSPAMLENFREEMCGNGNACATSKHFAEDSVALKALTSAVIFMLSRSGRLPEVVDDVSVEGVVAVVCLYSDLQMIGDSVELSRRAYHHAKELFKGAVAAAVLGLLAAAIKTGALGVLISTLLAHPMTLVVCIALTCTALPRINNALAEWEEKAAEQAADWAVAHEGMTLGDFVLPPLSRAKEKLMQTLAHVSSLLEGGPTGAKQEAGAEETVKAAAEETQREDAEETAVVQAYIPGIQA